MSGKTGVIYAIENKVNGKMYIGLTTDLKRRFNLHKRKLKNNNHFNKHLQNSFNKYGRDKFNFKVIEKNIPKNKLCKKEIGYIKKYKSYKEGYNLTLGGEGLKGYKATRKTREKLSKAFSGENHPFYGKKRSKETKDKISKNVSGDNNAKYWLGKKRPKMKEFLSKRNKKMVNGEMKTILIVKLIEKQV